MHWSLGLASLAALLGSAPGSLAADTSVIRDGETGFTFSEYKAAYAIGQYITFRVAVPSPAPSNYSIVYQIIAPNAAGWAGLAWGASMVNCPLTLGWAYGGTPVTSGRRTSARTMPQPYDGIKLQLLKTGTHTNGTHWQVTAVCQGCSSFVTTGSTTKTLSATGSNRLAFAYSKTAPSSTSPATSIHVHDAFSYWDHDFSSAGNVDFNQLVSLNM